MLGSLIINKLVHHTLALCLIGIETRRFAGLLLSSRRDLLGRESRAGGVSLRAFVLLDERHESLNVYLSEVLKSGSLLLNEWPCQLLLLELLNGLHYPLLVDWIERVEGLKGLRRHRRTVPSESKFSLRMARASHNDIILSLGFLRLEPLRLFCRACLR